MSESSLGRGSYSTNKDRGMMSSPRYWAAIATALACGQEAWAGEGDGQERSFLEDLPVVLSVSRLPQSLADAPGAVTVIDRETIRATGYRNVPDLFRLVPGFVVSWLNGHSPNVAYHGLSSGFPNRLQVLVDGRSIYSNQLVGGVDWLSQALSIEDIERIEVLRGSNSATYGSNAFLGVINIVTSHASQARGVFVSAARGEHGVNDKTVRFGYSQDSASVRLTLNQTKDSGLPNMVDSTRLQFGNLRADLRLTPEDEVTVAFGHQYGRRGQGYESDILNPTRPSYTQTSFQQVRWRHILASDSEVTLQYYRNDEKWIDEVRFGAPLLPFEVLFDQNRTATRDSLELQHHFRLGPSLRGVWGGEARRDIATSRVFLGTFDGISTQTRRVFGNLEWRPHPQWVLNGGAMWERYSLTGSDITPRLFANFEFLPGQVLRGGVSTATRTPAIFEGKANSTTTASGFPLDLAFIARGGVKPERVLAREAGYFGRFPQLGLQADVRIYEERLSDLIGTVPLPSPGEAGPGVPVRASTFTNVTSARLRGVEYQLQWSPFPATRFQLGHTEQRISNPDEDVRRSAPRHSTSLMWTQRLGESLTLNLIHYRVGEIRWLGFGDLVAPYRRTDLNLAWRFRLAGTKAELSATALNLFDKYNEFRNGTVPGEQEFNRRAYVTLRLEY